MDSVETMLEESKVTRGFLGVTPAVSSAPRLFGSDGVPVSAVVALVSTTE